MVIKRDHITLDHLNLVAPAILKINIKRLFEHPLNSDEKYFLEVWGYMGFPWNLEDECHRAQLAQLFGIPKETIEEFSSRDTRN